MTIELQFSLVSFSSNKWFKYILLFEPVFLTPSQDVANIFEICSLFLTQNIFKITLKHVGAKTEKWTAMKRSISFYLNNYKTISLT